MGCCFSRPSGPNSPHPAAQSSSSRTNTAPPPLSPLPPPASSSSSPTHRPRRHRRPLDQHINKPLRRHVWTSSSPGSRTWTRSALDAERLAFFDTRVTGRIEVWQTVRAALEVLWAAETATATATGNEEGGDDREALALAQSIFNAAGITLPTGDLSNGVYDAWGNWYQLPEYVVADPLDLVAEEDGVDEVKKDGAVDVGVGDEDEEDEEELERRREEKGKGVVDCRAQIGLVVRLSDGAKDLKMRVGKEEVVRSVVRRIREETGHSTTTRIRLVYFGKILRENGTLLEQGWTKGHVLTAFIYEPPS